MTSPTAVVVPTGSRATLRIAPRVLRNQAVLEVLDEAGALTQVRLSPVDLRRIAAAMMKVAGLLETASASDETTQA